MSDWWQTKKVNAPTPGPKSLIEVLCASSESTSFPPCGTKQLGTINDSRSQVIHSGGHGIVGTAGHVIEAHRFAEQGSPVGLWAPSVPMWASADVLLRLVAMGFQRKWARKFVERAYFD